MPQANVMPQYQAPDGVVPPMALRSPINPQILAAQRAARSAIPTQQPVSPFVNPILARVAANAAKMRQAQAAPTTPAGAAQASAGGAGAGAGAGGLPSSLGEAFSADLMSPTGQAITQASLAGLAAGGWSPTPVTFGQGIAAMGQAGMKGYADALKAQQPKIQVAGKNLFKIYPDGRVEQLSGVSGAEPIEIKSEAGRYVTDEGRIINAVLGKDGKLYEAGNVARGKELDPSKIEIVDQYTTMDYKSLEKHKQDNIIAPEKTLRIIDRFAQQIEAGPEGFVERQKASISSAIKNLSQNTEYNEAELMLALQQGTLTQLVGAARLELFGPGVMTEFEQAMAREILAGNFDNLRKEVALQRLNQFRQSFVPIYEDAIKLYNRQPIVKSGKMQLKPYSGFDWSRIGASRSGSGSAGASSGNTTTGGNTWSVIN